MNALTAGSRGPHCCRGSPAHSLGLLPQIGRFCRGFLRLPVTRRLSRNGTRIRSETSSAVQVRTVDEAAQQSYTLSLRTADPQTATGLVHRTAVAEAQNARRGTASTLTRSEVRGGGKKPYAQKGTGNARTGSRRTPLRPGGGVSFGPKPTDWSIKVNKKERRLAVATALHSAAADILVADNLKEGLSSPKTSVLAARLGGLGVDHGQQVLLIVEELTRALLLSSRNIPGVMLTTADRLVLREILRADKIIIEPKALNYLQEGMA